LNNYNINRLQKVVIFRKKHFKHPVNYRAKKNNTENPSNLTQAQQTITCEGVLCP